ncbi:Rieske (2Fe-2S) protein [Pseudomonas oligotrophica]|uniref:Rieske (2Fe-2S) protein n=1 Tax=Pseudomonas oligotrophica TaxID=2912055 RepID=UPI001F34D960|nr:Rieske (2Fe-2S) protein [Pseudomonas oligotrophica]MCF7201810.1 Rieske (2Fe-2S) protein [Pseudomonas oligotrophica]
MTPLCPSSALAEGQSRGFQLDGLQVVAIRRNGQVHLYENRCPHRGLPLEWQPDRFLDESGSLLQCASHGALFLIETGLCVAGPCEGRSLRALPHQEADGWIALAAPTEDDD